MNAARIDMDVLTRSIGSLRIPQDSGAGLEATLQQVVDAAAVLFHADGAGLMLLAEGEALRFVTATDPRAQRLEQLQERLQDGPCLAAFDGGDVQQLTGNELEQRWPAYARALREGGVQALLSMPVELDQGRIGALTIYLSEPREWDYSELTTLRIYAHLVGSLLRSALMAEAQGRLAGQLQWALDHRILIEQAKGALMARERLSEADAFEQLRRTARRDRRQVAEVARELLDSLTAPASGKPDVRPGATGRKPDQPAGMADR